MNEDPKPYNPLSRVALGLSVVQELLRQPGGPLPPVESFNGAGVYAIYYRGDHPLYAPVSSEDCETPIYVGKAIPKGGRKGVLGLDAATGSLVVSRLRQHAASIVATEQAAIEVAGYPPLRIADFLCRHLITDDIWIPLAEQLLIKSFKPVWNTGIDGFGNKDPGENRYGGGRSEWDELHPGRKWYDKMEQLKTPEEVAAKVVAHFGAVGAPVEPPSAADVAADGDVDPYTGGG